KTMRLIYPVDPLPSEVHIVYTLSEASRFFTTIANSASQIFLVTEEGISSLFLESVLAFFPKNTPSFVLPGGTQTKTRKGQEMLEEFLFEQRAGKDAWLICLGGGALLDVGGFVASTYGRGMRLAFIPTTFLAMVDACLGGKTAIDTSFGKNSLGTFYPAEEILISLHFLDSLPKSRMREGLAEVIKYGLIYDSSLFTLLQEQQAAWQKQDPVLLQTLVLKSLHVKKEVVQLDFQEKSLRRILNFGHTLGHALEAFFQYELPHGEAVAIGLSIESCLSWQLGYLQKEHLEEILCLLHQYDFPPRIPLPSYEELLPFLCMDKKNRSGEIRSVFLHAIGSCEPFSREFCAPFPLKYLQELLTEEFYECIDRRVSLQKGP
ncbi:MAG: 3-dehydroquinate synthase, partial [Chlamydiae bacterium]|nr:3-dehydroquinate synthase [Chlamydiota bacterium]